MSLAKILDRSQNKVRKAARPLHRPAISSRKRYGVKILGQAFSAYTHLCYFEKVQKHPRFQQFSKNEERPT
jgi:hypothetical protein